MIVSLLVAADENNGIGYQNKLPWHLPADLKYFKQLTLHHHVLMGRKTFESIGKPLPKRINMVLTTDKNYVQAGTVTVNTMQEAIRFASDANETELFVIGGAKVLETALPFAHKLFLTRIHAAFQADTLLPFHVSPQWKLLSREEHAADEKNRWAYAFEVYEIKPANA